MRSGFCNLFTTVQPKENLDTAYIDTLVRQAERVRAALSNPAVARFAIVGGTPTCLKPDGLHRLFDIAERTFGVDLHTTPVSVETSPRTADSERLNVLHERGVGRISIGVQ